MAVLWVGNFDFEHELASPAYVPTNRLRRLSLELAWHLSAFAEVGDGIVMPEAPCPEFVAHWNTLTGENLTLSASLAECGRFDRIEYWGRSRTVHGTSLAVPTRESVRLANSRRWSVTALKRSFNDGPIVFSAVVWAELASPAIHDLVLTRAFEWLRPRREDFPFAAAYPAGVAVDRWFRAR